MRCLVDSFKEISNKSEKPFQTCKAHTGIALLITGLILAILGAVATALTVTGLLSMLPSFVMFVFPSVALLGLIIVGVGTGLLMQRYRLKQAEINEESKINEVVEQTEIIVKNIRDKISQRVDSNRFSQFLYKLERLITNVRDYARWYKEKKFSYGIVREHLERTLSVCRSDQNNFEASPNNLKNPSKISE